MPCSADAELDRLWAGDRRRAYAHLLAREGPGWWFRMDISRIRRHIGRFLETGSSGLSARLWLLQGAAAPLPASQGLADTIRPLGVLHHVLLTRRDWEGAAMGIGLALAAVWDFGTDFRLARPWTRRAERLLERPIPPVCRAHLLAFLGLFRLFSDGDAGAACQVLHRQRHEAEQARCPELVLYGAAVHALALLFSGHPHRAEVLLEDVAPLEPSAAPGSHARAYFPMVLGVLMNATGRPEGALEALGRASAALAEDDMPVSMRLQLASYRLMAAALSGDALPAATLEAPVRQLALAHHNHLHAAFLHFSLGTAYLRAGRPYRALVHADEGVRGGVACHSPIPRLLNGVLRGQALAGLQETEEADACLEEVVGEGVRGGMSFFVRAAVVERAEIALRRGRPDAARRAMDEAGALQDPGSLWTPFRGPSFNETFGSRLHPPRQRRWEGSDQARPLDIRTLGGFEMRLGEAPMFDRRWGSGRTLALLKLIIALGGHKVPAAQLILDLWPDAEGDRGYANFKTALSRLRKVPGAGIGRGWIQLKWGRVSLAQGVVAVDSLAFVDAVRIADRSGAAADFARAASLYRGDFLPNDHTFGIFGRQRRELRDALVRMADGLARVFLEGDRSVEPIPVLVPATELVPDSERLHARCMEVFLAKGYPGEALRAYRRAEASLRDTLGVTPGPQLQRLHARARSA